MAKTKVEKFKFRKGYTTAFDEARKNYEEFAKFYYSPPEPNGFWEFNGGGYMHIGVDPGKVNGQEIKKDPIEQWVERWIDELGTV